MLSALLRADISVHMTWVSVFSLEADNLKHGCIAVLSHASPSLPPNKNNHFVLSYIGGKFNTDKSM